MCSGSSERLNVLIATNPVIATSDGLEGLRCMVQVSFVGARLKGRVKVLLG